MIGYRTVTNFLEIFERTRGRGNTEFIAHAAANHPTGVIILAAHEIQRGCIEHRLKEINPETRSKVISVSDSQIDRYLRGNQMPVVTDFFTAFDVTASSYWDYQSALQKYDKLSNEHNSAIAKIQRLKRDNRHLEWLVERNEKLVQEASVMRLKFRRAQWLLESKEKIRGIQRKLHHIFFS